MMKIDDIDKTLIALNSNLTVIQAFERAKKVHGDVALLFLVRNPEMRYLLRNIGNDLNKRFGYRIAIGIANPDDEDWIIKLAGFMANDVVAFIDDFVSEKQKNILLSIYG